MMRAMWLALVSVVMLAGLTGQASALSCDMSTAGTLNFAPAFARLEEVDGGGSIGVTCNDGVSNETVNICLALGSTMAGSISDSSWPLIEGKSSPRFTVKAGSTVLDESLVSIGSVELMNGTGSKVFDFTGKISWNGFSGEANSYSTTFPEIQIYYGLDSDCSVPTISRSLTVTGSVLSTCSVTASPMAFGTIDADIRSPITSTSNIVVDCTVGGAYTVSLSSGGGGVAPFRAMTNDMGKKLRYELYKDLGRTEIWGDDSESTLTGTASPSDPSNTTYTVYGTIPVPSGQPTFPSPVPAGIYNDTVVVTITY